MLDGKKTLTGLGILLIPYLDSLYQYGASLPEGALPVKAKIAIGGLGWFLAVYGRLVAKKPLT